MHLESSNASIDVDLQGGRLASLRIGGLDILVPETERPTRWGSFPMIPWCGRMPHGHLDFDGVGYDFPITSPPHANHGRTHLQAWTQIDDATIGTALVDPWPFGGTATQRFDLADNSLTVTAEVRATEHVMPAMIGWHPWFRRQLGRGGDAQLSFDATSIYAVDDEDTPTGELIDVPPGPWDACFVGLTSDPVVEWPGALRLTLSSTFDHWVIFTEPEHALCVEPQSGPPNQFNLDPRVLQPGESLTGSMMLSWNVQG